MKHFLDLADLTAEDIQKLLDNAVALKAELRKGGNRPILKGKVLGMIFEKPSLRTRISFEVAALQLGGHAFYISPAEIGLGTRESVADIARVLSRYVDGIMARTFSHDHIIELAKYATVPVINGLSDYNHPCQGLADLLTIHEKKGKLQGLKLAYVGDGNNVARTLLIGASKMGIQITITSPAGYSLSKEGQSSEVEFTDDPAAAVQGADIIYTDTWTSMGQEDEMEMRKKVFMPYQVNSELVARAKSDAIVMHCLPAHRGAEITDEVMDSTQSVVFDQAENRLHAQKAILASLLH